MEATTDVERALGTAPGASIDLIVSASSETEDGVIIALLYAIDTKEDPILSDSFASCESAVGSAAVNAWDQLAQQAAAEGISFFVGSGDAGAAGCDQAFAAPPATQTASPNFACTSAYVTCVGGTEFNDAGNPGQYWSGGSSPSTSSAFGYIPEGAWNEPTKSSGTYQIAASGGGPSAFIPKPSWQTGNGVPDDGQRDTPDLSFPASSHDGYYTCSAFNGADCTTGYFASLYGTSVAAPSMAGIAALIDQKLGAPQGNLNPALYRLATTTPDVFHDVTVASSGVVDCDVETPSMCNNSTPSASALSGGLAGFEVGPGYDLATGLGSIDAAKLVDALAGVQPSFAQSSSGSIIVSRGAATGNSTVISVTPSAGFTGTVSLSCAVTTAPPGAQYMPTCSIPDSITVSGSSPATATLEVLTTAVGAMLSLPGGATALACACLFAVPRRRRARLVVLGLMLAGIVFTGSCGDGDTAATATVSYSPPGTTPGAYVVTVTGASGSVTSTTTIPVTVD
jgi:subtilase family serine protease